MVFYIAQCYTFAVHNATLLYYTKHAVSHINIRFSLSYMFYYF